MNVIVASDENKPDDFICTAGVLTLNNKEEHSGWFPTVDPPDLNMHLPAPAGVLKASCDVSGTFGLFYDAHVCASTSWPTFIVFQPICSLFSAFSKHRRGANVTERRRDAAGHAEQRPRCTCQRLQQRSSMGRMRSKASNYRKRPSKQVIKRVYKRGYEL